MSARTLEREDAVAVRTAIARTSSRGRGAAVTLTDPDAGDLLAHAALEASAAGWLVVEGRGPDPLADVARRLTDPRPHLLEGTGRPLAVLLGGGPRLPHDLAFALLAVLDRLDGPVLVAVHDVPEADAVTVATLALLADHLPRTRCVLVHAYADTPPPDVPAPDPVTADRFTACPPRLAEGEEVLTSAVEDARRRASSRDFGLASGWRGIVRSRAGVTAEALPDLLAARAHGADDQPLRRAMLLAALVDCRLAAGDLHRASRLRPELVELAAGAGAVAAFGRYGLAELAAAAGDHSTALATYVSAGQCADDDQPLPVTWRRGAAVAALHLGRPAEARRLAVADLDLARACSAPDRLAQALRTLAAIDLGASGTALLEQAHAILADTWAPRLTAQVETDLAGQLVLTGGDGRRAVALLRSAEAFALEQRLAPLLQRVQRVLSHLGATPLDGPGRAGNLGVLEREVAVLLARGLTEDGVAGHLLVTVGEVRAALRQALRVLGLRSPARLATVLGG